MDSPGHTLTAVAAAIGENPKRVQNWRDRRFIKPMVPQTDSWARFSAADIAALAVMKALVDRLNMTPAKAFEIASRAVLGEPERERLYKRARARGMSEAEAIALALNKIWLADGVPMMAPQGLVVTRKADGEWIGTVSTWDEIRKSNVGKHEPATVLPLFPIVKEALERAGLK
jgi:hypothetical protein